MILLVSSLQFLVYYAQTIAKQKKLFRIYQVFPQQNILSYDICKLSEIVLSFTEFKKLDKIENSTNCFIDK